MNKRRHLIEGFLYQKGMRVWEGGQISCGRWRKEKRKIFSFHTMPHNWREIMKINCLTSAALRKYFCSACEPPIEECMWVPAANLMYSFCFAYFGRLWRTERKRQLTQSKITSDFNKNEKKTRNWKSFHSQGAPHIDHSTSKCVPSSLVLPLAESDFSLSPTKCRRYPIFTSFFKIYFTNASSMLMSRIFAWHCYCHAIVVHCMRLSSFFSLTLSFVPFCYFIPQQMCPGNERCECASVRLSIVENILSLCPDSEWKHFAFCVGNLFFCIQNSFHCIFVILLLSFDNRHRSISALCCLFLIIIFFLFQSVLGIVWQRSRRRWQGTNVSIYIRRHRMLPFKFLAFQLCGAEITWPNFVLSMHYYCRCLTLCIHLCECFYSDIFGVWQQRSKSKRNKSRNLGYSPEEIHSTCIDLR